MEQLDGGAMHKQQSNSPSQARVNSATVAQVSSLSSRGDNQAQSEAMGWTPARSKHSPGPIRVKSGGSTHGGAAHTPSSPKLDATGKKLTTTDTSGAQPTHGPATTSSSGTALRAQGSPSSPKSPRSPPGLTPRSSAHHRSAEGHRHSPEGLRRSPDGVRSPGHQLLSLFSC